MEAKLALAERYTQFFLNFFDWARLDFSKSSRVLLADFSLFRLKDVRMLHLGRADVNQINQSVTLAWRDREKRKLARKLEILLQQPEKEHLLKSLGQFYAQEYESHKAAIIHLCQIIYTAQGHFFLQICYGGKGEYSYYSYQVSRSDIEKLVLQMAFHGELIHPKEVKYK